MIKVGVIGALGKMGKEVIKRLYEEEGMQLVLAADIISEGIDIGLEVIGRETGVKTEMLTSEVLKAKNPDVVIDFTQPQGIFNHVKMYIEAGVKSVIGTTGLKEEEINKLKEISKEKNTGCFIAPNFSTGAVLLMMFAKQAAKYFKNAEIIELHHNQKKDAPSGTAIKTAQLMAENNDNFTQGNCEEQETIKGSRGGISAGNIHIHSVRMPGYIASQEVIFGSSGQIFKIRHDSMDRKCYMDGIMLAVNHVYKNNDFVYGLDNIL